MTQTQNNKRMTKKTTQHKDPKQKQPTFSTIDTLHQRKTLIWGNPLSTYAKFSERLTTFFTLWYAHVRTKWMIPFYSPDFF